MREAREFRPVSRGPMWDTMWYRLHITIHMKTIQMTIDAANFDNLQTVPEGNIGARITRLTPRKMKEAAAAISFALALDED
jgi:mRNA-degrading endonuclease toxin of MazEF toxin-antitoxin module